MYLNAFLFEYSMIIILGAFIIPYFCIYFLIGTPLFFLEMSLGQFTSSGAAAAFKMSRMFKGSPIVYILMINNKFST